MTRPGAPAATHVHPCQRGHPPPPSARPPLAVQYLSKDSFLAFHKPCNSLQKCGEIFPRKILRSTEHWTQLPGARCLLTPTHSARLHPKLFKPPACAKHRRGPTQAQLSSSAMWARGPLPPGARVPLSCERHLRLPTAFCSCGQRSQSACPLPVSLPSCCAKQPTGTHCGCSFISSF